MKISVEFNGEKVTLKKDTKNILDAVGMCVQCLLAFGVTLEELTGARQEDLKDRIKNDININ